MQNFNDYALEAAIAAPPKIIASANGASTSRVPANRKV
jgi:hypothetical protein